MNIIAAVLLFCSVSANAIEYGQLGGAAGVAGVAIAPATVAASTVTITGTGTKCFSVDDPTFVVDCNLGSVSASGSVTVGSMTSNGNTLVAGEAYVRLLADKETSTRGFAISPAAYDGLNYIRAYNNVSGTFELQSYNTGDSAVEASITLDPHPAGNIGFNTGDGVTATRKMTINEDGSVGIGTTAPATKLHMSSGTLTIDGTGAPTTGGALCLNAGGAMSKCTSAVDASGNCTCP